MAARTDPTDANVTAAGYPAFLTKLLLLRRIRACLLRCAASTDGREPRAQDAQERPRSGSSTYCSSTSPGPSVARLASTPVSTADVHGWTSAAGAGCAGAASRRTLLRNAGSLFVVGFLAMLGQVVLLRELAVASFGVELIYLLGLSLWLAAGAAGAFLGRLGPPGQTSRTASAFLLVAALIPLELTFLRGARLLFGGVSGAFLPLGRQVAAAALALVPAGAVLGLLFLLAARGLIAAGGSLAAAYAWESAGGALGSVAATLALHWGVPNLALAAGCGVAGAAAAAAAGSARRWSVPVIAVLLVLLAMSGPLDRFTTSWNHRDLVETADTPYGRVAITRAGGQLTLFENDAVAFESEGTEAEEIVHLSAPQAPPAPRVLMIGGGVAGIAAEVLKHKPRRVDYVESNRGMYRALFPHLPPEARRALESEPVRVVFADPRRFLSDAASYDLILIASPEPSSGQSNRFYTREFFRLCAARLSPGGVVALRLPSSENFWTPLLARRNGSVHAALSDAFPDVLVLPGSTDTLLGSKTRLSRDPVVLAGRLRDRGIAARLVTPEYLRYLLTNDRLDQVARLLSGAGAPPNSDGTPVCYRETAFLWLGKFIPALERAGPPDRRAGIENHDGVRRELEQRSEHRFALPARAFRPLPFDDIKFQFPVGFHQSGGELVIFVDGEDLPDDDQQDQNAPANGHRAYR